MQTIIELGHVPTVSVTLTIRVIQAMVVGPAVMRIVGNKTLEAQWDGLAKTAAGLLFDGIGAVDGEVRYG